MKEYKSLMPEITIKYKSGDVKKCKITNSSDIFEIAKEFLNKDTIELYEEAICFYLNKANNTIGWTKISQGGVSGTVMDPRLIFQKAILSGSSSVILVHNHPSCNLQPSEQDKKITQQIRNGGKLLEIVLFDHLIISGDAENYYSFADNGLI